MTCISFYQIQNQMIKAVYENIRLENKEVVILGSLGKTEGIFKKMFIDKVHQIDQALMVKDWRLSVAFLMRY